MKRVIAIVLALLLLTGCAPSPAGENTVTFYYPRKNLVYSFSDLPIGAEARDCADEALEYMLRLYLLGPTDENLESHRTPSRHHLPHHRQEVIHGADDTEKIFG